MDPSGSKLHSYSYSQRDQETLKDDTPFPTSPNNSLRKEFSTKKTATSARRLYVNSYSRHALNTRVVSPVTSRATNAHAASKGLSDKAISRLTADDLSANGQLDRESRPRLRGGPTRKPKTNKATMPMASVGPSRPAVSYRGNAQSSKNYTIRPIIPAARRELLDVAKAMHREEFAPRVKKLFDPDREAALQAIETGLYIGWRCPDYKWDCIRVGNKSKCFCGHLLNEHQEYSGNMYQVKCLVSKCPCKTFSFMPSRPEDIGEWWLQTRPGFDVSSWRAKCRCKHTHEEHGPNNPRRCKIKSCPCFEFESNFLCASCDKHWENHETVFETADQRSKAGIPYGEEYLPFHELPDLRNIVLTGKNNNQAHEALTSGPYAIPRSKPTDLARQLQGERM